MLYNSDVKYAFVIFSFFFLLETHSQELDDIEEEKKYILINGPKMKSVSPILEGQLRKTIMSVFLKDKTYSLLLNNNVELKKSKLNAFKITITGERKISEDKRESFSLKMVLSDERKGKQVRELENSFIAKRHLFYRARVMVLEMIYGDDYLEMLDKEAREKEKKRKKNKKNRRPKSPSNKPPEKKPNEPKEPEEQSDAEAALKKKKEKARKAKIAKKKKKKKKKSKVAISKFSSPDLDLKKTPKDNRPTKGAFKAYYDFSYGLGYLKETLESKALVKILTTNAKSDVTNNLAALQVHIRGNARLAPEDTLGLAGILKLSRIMGKTDYEISAPMGAEFFIFKGFDLIPVNFQFGFAYEKYSFANLGTAASGIQPWESTIIWNTVGINVKIPVKNYWLSAGASMGKVFSGTTNYKNKSKPTPLEGKRLDLYIRSKISGKYSLEVRKSTISTALSSSKRLENSQDQTVLSLNYN